MTEFRRRRAPGPNLVLATVSLGVLLAPLNSTMLAVALPRLRDEFDVSAAAAAWLVSGYLIAMAVVQPVAGRLGDEIGRERVFRWALLAFLVVSLGAACSPFYGLLVLFRILQAVFGAALMPNGMAMLRAAVPPEQFGRFAGMNSAVIGSAAAGGPLLGGLILDLGSWRWLFVANVPVVLGALLMARLLAPSTSQAARSVRTDWIGLGVFAVLLVAVTLALNQLRSDRLLFVWLTVGTVALGWVFWWQQRRSKNPTAAWSLFRRRSFVGASSHILLMNLAMYTTLLAIPFFVTDIQGRDAAAAGVLLSAMAILQAATSPIVGRLSDVVGRRTPALAGSVLAVLAAAALVALISRDVPLLVLAIPVALLGLGVGLGFVSASAAAVESVPVHLSGSAAGTQSMMRYLGSIVGSGFLAGLLTLEGGGDAGITTFRLLFAVVLAFALVSIAAAALIRPRPDTSEVEAIALSPESVRQPAG